MEWWHNYFDETYLRFWVTLTPERVQKEVNGIINYLDIKPGQSILDVPCGNGRITVPLAQRGFKVTGLDISNYMLNLGKKEVEKNHLDVDLVKGDMRNIPHKNEFDAAIAIFQPLGMFGKKEDDLTFLNSINHSLKKEGKFLLETRHRDAVEKKEVNEYWEYDGTVILQNSSFDPFTSIRTQTLKWLENGRWKEKKSLGLYYTVTEIISMLEDTGFKVKKTYGDFMNGEFKINKNNIIIISEKI
jgi:cyclopropane fatty-acyl-phospholipid synthase-like methyltransferase